jgi:hypothetical protein
MRKTRHCMAALDAKSIFFVLMQVLRRIINFGLNIDFLL